MLSETPYHSEYNMGLGTYAPANVPFFGVPDKSEAGDQLDQLSQEDCSCGDEHVPGPDVMKRCFEILHFSILHSRSELVSPGPGIPHGQAQHCILSS